MKTGYLSAYFTGVAAKRLSAVEVHPESSNQHEFNGVKELIALLGKEQLQNSPARFIWLDKENQGFSEDSRVTWYDAREKHPARSEYRLYFRSNPVMERANAGDLLIVARRPSGELMIIVVARGSTEENRLVWLFGFSDQMELPGISDQGKVKDTPFQFRNIEIDGDQPVGFAERFILEEIGVNVGIEQLEGDHLDTLIDRFQEGFPPTAVFSRFARETLPGIEPLEDPDAALLAWMAHEEKLFRRLECREVAVRLEQGFHNDNAVNVDGFITYSLSIQNRRKSRAGFALEHHLAEIFCVFKLKFEQQAVTEHNSRPDFLFPGLTEYQDQDFPKAGLSILGAKSTCKDRWRQVLSEAERIPDKHLLTLEPGISENQTNEMQANRVQLVLPKALHLTFTEGQRKWLLDVNDFVCLVKEQQRIG